MRALFSQKKKKKKKKTRAQQHVPSSSSLRFFTRSLSFKNSDEKSVVVVPKR